MKRGVRLDSLCARFWQASAAGTRCRRVAAALAMACLVLGPAVTAQNLTGAGGSFPYPLYSRWFAEYHRAHPEARINYQPVGSGAGIRQLLAGVVDFGATESPLLDAELARSPGKLLHIPTLLGAVVPIYNLPRDGATSARKADRVRFAPEVLADIFLGRLVRWNDSRLLRDNPAARLPDLPIVPVYRADGAGTTFVFTDFLCKISPSFANEVGRGVAVRWPVGIGGKGNEGVAGLVRATPGALGYAETAYSGQEGIEAGSVRNAAGAWIEATPESVAAAAQARASDIPADFRVSLTNTSGARAYAIVSFTWLLLRNDDLGTPRGRTLAGFVDWMLAHGESEAASFGYAPLPSFLASRVRASLRLPQ